MKNIKRLLSVMLILVLTLSFAACHEKDEIAVKVGDVEFTSAYYMCAFMETNDEAKAKVDESLSEEESSSDEEVDYLSKKIDNKEFETWVRDTTIDKLKEIAAYKILCKENELEVDKEDIDTLNNTIDSYWDQYYKRNFMTTLLLLII